MTVLKKELLKNAAALKKQLLLKGKPCVTFEKSYSEKCEEVTIPKIKLSENIAIYARGKITISRPAKVFMRNLI